MPNSAVKAELETLLTGWNEDPLHVRPAFETFANWLMAQSDIRLEYKARPGVSYSLRAQHRVQQERSLFVLVDIVDDNPEERWLSVCFYADMIQDPQELGDNVPQGLNGEDACCFNLDADDSAMRSYIMTRMQEAAQSAAAK